MIFVDRSVPRAVARALQEVRDDCIWLEDQFPHDTKDEIWLRTAGAHGWLVVGRDRKIWTRPGERQAVIDNGVGYFCLTQKQPLTRWQYLKLLALTLDDMERLFANISRPFIFSVGRTGKITRVPLRPN